MRHFQYVTLKPREIRVLELKPGADEDGLVGNIRHQILSPEDNEIPKFEALSYTWGDPSRPQSISLTNDTLPGELVSANETTILNIGDNLTAALRSLRLPTETRVLWCDQICINQSDFEERGCQVQRMSDIYRFADRVVVWLGPETSWSTMAMETMRWAGGQIESMFLDANTNKFILNYTKSADKRVSESFGPLPISADQFLAFEQLVSLNWHKRLWTFQEIVLADKNTCIIKFGKDEMLWSEFMKGFILAAYQKTPPPNRLRDKSAFTSNANMIGNKIVACVLDLRDTYKFEWIQLIDFSKEYECSDSRDKVFAIQGLAEDGGSLIPDYTKSAKEIYTFMCLDHITRYGDIEFLRQCNAAASPSWVPDLERPTSMMAVNAHATPFSPASAYLVEPGVLEVAGITGAELIGDPMSLPNKRLSQTHTEYRQGITAFIQDFMRDGSYQDDSCLDKFIMMLTYGSVRDYSLQKVHPITISSLHSLEEWRCKIRQWLSGIEDEAVDPKNFWMTEKMFISMIPNGNTATSCAKTCDGDFVRVPSESRSGDIIAVFLGLRDPIVLRPQSPSGYTVVGPCYHPGLAHGKALLGKDFKGWQPLWDRNFAIDCFYKEGHDFRKLDPRLDDVPLDDGYTQIITKKGGWPCWAPPGSSFQRYDPRMSEEGLKKRGVPIRKYRLL